MRTATVTRFGPPEVLQVQEVPDPTPGRGQVVVDVAAADVLWVETMIRKGDGREHFSFEPPYVPGGGVAGTVSSVGDGVDPQLVGQRVVASVGRSGGGYADRLVADTSVLVPVPDGVDLPVAAALLADAVTAFALAEVTKLTGADTVLVVGASGGLGIVSVQLAKSRGARVVATGRDERKLERIRGLGADAVVDTEEPGWVDEARAALGGSGATVVLDNIGGQLGQAAFELAAPGARFSAHGTPSGEFTAIDPERARARDVALFGIADAQLSPEQIHRFTEQALAETAAGRIRPIIGQTFPLDEAADAHRAIEERSVFGKTLLTP